MHVDYFALLNRSVPLDLPEHYHLGDIKYYPPPYESQPDSKAYIPFDDPRVQNYFSAHFLEGYMPES